MSVVIDSSSGKREVADWIWRRAEASCYGLTSEPTEGLELNRGTEMNICPRFSFLAAQPGRFPAKTAPRHVEVYRKAFARTAHFS